MFSDLDDLGFGRRKAEQDGVVIDLDHPDLPADLRPVRAPWADGWTPDRALAWPWSDTLEPGAVMIRPGDSVVIDHVILKELGEPFDPVADRVLAITPLALRRADGSSLQLGSMAWTHANRVRGPYALQALARRLGMDPYAPDPGPEDDDDFGAREAVADVLEAYQDAPEDVQALLSRAALAGFLAARALDTGRPLARERWTTRAKLSEAGRRGMGAAKKAMAATWREAADREAKRLIRTHPDMTQADLAARLHGKFAHLGAPEPERIIRVLLRPMWKSRKKDKGLGANGRGAKRLTTLHR